jgi:hypothetical protein
MDSKIAAQDRDDDAMHERIATMSSTVAFAPGGYAFMPGVFQYSAGVRALPGYRIERLYFAQPVPLAQGFDRVAAVIRSAGRPLTSFCACPELEKDIHKVYDFRLALASGCANTPAARGGHVIAPRLGHLICRNAQTESVLNTPCEGTWIRSTLALAGFGSD